MVLVSVIMGSKSDYDLVQDAVAVLQEFKVPYETRIVSAHRTPEFMAKFALEAEGRGVKVIIAAAGGAAHLPGMVASLTPIPVIGLPVPSKHLSGIDSLLSIVQMPAGVPVATVAIGASKNSALLAVRILALSDARLMREMKDFLRRQSEAVLRDTL
jgi:5-(carboxyamino)imidazole ribonucleotide mutase